LSLIKYYSGDQIKKNYRGRACGTYGRERGAYRVYVGRPEEKRPFRRPRNTWKDHIKMDLQEVGWRGTDWIALALGKNRSRALVNAVKNLRVP
jgi:hypothetical protein